MRINIEKAKINEIANNLKANETIMQHKIEDLFSKVYEKAWKDTMNVSSFAAFVYPNCENEEKIIIFAQYYAFINLLDDFFEINNSEADNWIQIYKKEKVETNNCPHLKGFTLKLLQNCKSF